MSKKAHILCVAAGDGEGRYAPLPGFSTFTGSVADVVAGDLWVGPRPRLEELKPVRRAKGPFSFADDIADAISGKDGGKGISDLIGGIASLGDIFKDEVEAIAYPDYVQIIPYYLFRNRGRFLRYVRPDKGSETRLHGKVSIGIGGHVDLTDIVADADGRVDLVATLELAGKREAKEEIGAEVGGEAFRFVGTVYATDTEVDCLHLGIVGICDLTDEQAAGLTVNHEIGDYAFLTLSDVLAEADADPNKHLETWTRLVIESNPLA